MSGNYDGELPTPYTRMQMLMRNAALEMAKKSELLLKEVTIPDGVTAIEPMAFRSRLNITSVKIPDSVTTIGVETFGNCTSLTSITIPDSVTTIGFNAFKDCSALTSITIPNSVHTIENTAFHSSGLETITINRIANDISGAPWGATNATVVWNG